MENNGQQRVVEFDQIKMDLIFQENRLKTLYEGFFSEDILIWLDEKGRTRDDTRAECGSLLKQAELNAHKAFRQKWTALGIPAYLELEIEPRYIVGSPYYEAPEAADRATLLQLVERIRTLALSVPVMEQAENHLQAHLEEITQTLQGVEWGRRDVQTLLEALSAKAGLLAEMSNLTTDSHELQWRLSCLETKLEELHRREEQVVEDGEAMLLADVLSDRIALREDIFRLTLRRLDRIREASERCLSERQHKVGQWKLGAASMEVLRDNKVAKLSMCKKDMERLVRGTEYVAEQATVDHQAYEAQMEESDKKLEALQGEAEGKKEELYKLAEQFKHVEERLRAISYERNSVVAARLQLIQQEAQRAADFQEFVEFSNEHRSGLDQTSASCDAAVQAIFILQEYTTGSSNFLEQDFQQTKDHLREMERGVLERLAGHHKEYVRDLGSSVRRCSRKAAQYDDSTLTLEARAEECKETLDPMAKHWVLQLQQMKPYQEECLKELGELQEKLSYVSGDVEGEPEAPPRASDEGDDEELDAIARMSALTVLSKVLTLLRDKKEGALEETKERLEWESAMRAEKMLDNRDVMLESNEDRVIEERDATQHLSVRAAVDAAYRKTVRDASAAAAAAAVAPGDPIKDRRTPLEKQRDAKDAAAAARRSHPPPANAVSVAPPKRETRAIAGYAAPAALPDNARGGAGGGRGGEDVGDTPMKMVQKKGLPGSEGTPAAVSLASGRLTPMEMARDRRKEPRTIAALQQHNGEREERRVTTPALMGFNMM